MVTRIFREYVWSLKTAGTGEDVHDVTGIMQDIAPRKGFKLLGAIIAVLVSDAMATDASVAYINLIKNISEAAHHITPDADGEITDVRVDGVLYTVGMTFRAADAYRYFKYTPSKPIAFDANDRLNVELTNKNKDAASGVATFTLLLDVEIA
ncbi:hypothetical protein ES703_97249 [subsurface metagenome]